MKKLGLIVVAMINCSTAAALPLGNPTEPGLLTNGVAIYSYGCYDFCDPCFSWIDAWSLRIGFYGDYVFNRFMKVDFDRPHHIQTTTLMTNAGYLALDFCNKFDLFATLGVTNFGFEGDINSFPTLSGLPGFFEARFAPEFSWSIGGRAIVWELSSFGIGLEGQYFRSTPDVRALVTRVAGNSYTVTYLDHYETLYREWQIGIGGAFRFEVNCPDIAMVPYMGVAWSSARWDLGNQEVFANGTQIEIARLVDLKTQRLWSYALGTSLTFFEMAQITVEGRFAAEKAFFVQGQLRF